MLTFEECYAARPSNRAALLEKVLFEKTVRRRAVELIEARGKTVQETGGPLVKVAKAIGREMLAGREPATAKLTEQAHEIDVLKADNGDGVLVRVAKATARSQLAAQKLETADEEHESELTRMARKLRQGIR